MCCVPRPAPSRCSATAAAFASFSSATGSSNFASSRSRRSMPGQRHVHGRADPAAASGRSATESRSRAQRRSAPLSSAIASSSCATSALLVGLLGRVSRAARSTAPSARHEATGELRPAEVDRDDMAVAHEAAATIAARRGRERQAVQGLPRRPVERPGQAAQASRGGDLPTASRKSTARAKPKRGGWKSWRRWRRIVLSVIGVVLLVMLVWAVLGYLAVNRGVKAANERLEPQAAAALSPDVGLAALDAVEHPDPRRRRRREPQGREPAAAAPTRSCCCAPTRTTTGSRSCRSRATCASRSRARRGQDQRRVLLRRERALAIQTVEALTGLPVNHVIVVDFSTFNEVVDAIGGITIVQSRSRSSRTSSTAR